MEPKIIKTKDYIEFIGHYDDIAKCAKLSALASLYAIDSKVGYAKFPIEYEKNIIKALNCFNIFATNYIFNSTLSSSSWSTETVEIFTIKNVNTIKINNINYDVSQYTQIFAQTQATYKYGEFSFYIYGYNNGSTLIYSYSSNAKNSNLNIYITNIKQTVQSRFPFLSSAYYTTTKNKDINNSTFYDLYYNNNDDCENINYTINIKSYTHLINVIFDLPQEPAGNSISIGTLHLSASYVGTVEVDKIYSGTSLVYEKSSPTPVMPVKGDIIELNLDNTLKQFRVIKANNNICEVVYVDILKNGKFNDNESNAYKNSTLDAYYSDWYNSLSTEAKNAIQLSSITQYEYTFSSSSYNASTHASYAGYNTKTAIETIQRYVYALDASDIEEYYSGSPNLQGTFSENDLCILLWNSTPAQETKNRGSFLRSSRTSVSNFVYVTSNTTGAVGNINVTTPYGNKPAFTIDLSKIDFTIK